MEKSNDTGNTFYTKIKKYRKAQKLTIQDLADKAQITPSMLSQIERGLANPSINTMKLIAQALDTPLFMFFTEEDNLADMVVTPETRRRITLPSSNDINYELLTPNLNGKIEFCRLELAPKTATSDSPMCHEGEEVALILEGTINVSFDNAAFTLNAGDSIRIPPQTNHKWYNPMDYPVVLVFAITPPSF